MEHKTLSIGSVQIIKIIKGSVPSINKVILAKKASDKDGADDADDDSDDDEEELSPYYCRHCFTCESKDWHHGGKEKLLLCTECRVYYKR